MEGWWSDEESQEVDFVLRIVAVDTSGECFTARCGQLVRTGNVSKMNEVRSIVEQHLT